MKHKFSFSNFCPGRGLNPGPRSLIMAVNVTTRLRRHQRYNVSVPHTSCLNERQMNGHGRQNQGKAMTNHLWETLQENRSGKTLSRRLSRQVGSPSYMALILVEADTTKA